MTWSISSCATARSWSTPLTAATPCHGLATLDDVETRVADFPFLRINRSAVVNLNRVKEFSPWVGGKYTLILDDDGSTELTLSRGRVKDFKKRLGI